MTRSREDTMSLIGRMIGAVTQRFTDGFSVGDSRLAKLFGANSLPGSTVPVTEENCLTISAVWAATRIVSGSVAALPFKVYRREANRRVELDPTPGDPRPGIPYRPNPWMTAITFWETIVAQALLRGNAYAEIEFNGRGQPVALWPLKPGTVRPRVVDDRLVYEGWTGGGLQQVPMERIFHIPGLGGNGIEGESVIGLARRNLGLGATAEQAGASFFGDGMRPSMLLKYPGSLQELQRSNLKENLGKEHGGSEKFGRTLVLWGNMEAVPLSIPPADAQFIETRRFSLEDVARWFSVPPHLLRDLSRSTNNNIEHQGQDFVIHTLVYWLQKISQEFDRKILGNDPRLYSNHTLNALVRGDIKTRAEYYSKGRQWGWLSPNDIRALEDQNPIPGGDVYLTPTNMTSDPNGFDPDKGGDPSPVQEANPPGAVGEMFSEAEVTA